MPESVESPASAPAAKPRRVNHAPWYTYIALFPACLLMRLWLATLRMRGAEEAARVIREERGPIIVCFWHNRLIIASELRRRYRNFKPMNGLVSASKDGAWLVAFFNLMRIGAVRGSSSWRGGRALVELSEKLREGEDVAITPDGPRGPMYDFKKGPAALALAETCPVLLIGAGFSKAKRLRSWDKFILPYPFSKVELRAELVRHDASWAGLDDVALANLLREKLLRLNAEADAAAEGK